MDQSPSTRIYIHNEPLEFADRNSLQPFFDYLRQKDGGVAIMHGHVWEKRFWDENPDAKLLC